MIVQKAKREAQKSTSDVRQFIEQDPALLVTLTESDPKNITVARPVALKKMCKILFLASTQNGGLIEVIPHPNLAEGHACMMAIGIMDVYIGRPFRTIIATLGKKEVHLLKHQKVVNVRQ